MTNEWHFIGIAGIGMSGLASLLLDKKERVSGSDPASNAMTTKLKQRGAVIVHEHLAENVPPNATVVYSTDIPETNPEWSIAKKRGATFLHRSDLLHQLMQSKKALTVTGTHGKTTTTSLLATTLIHAGLSPSYAIGGVLPAFGVNAGLGEGDYFVAEADESDGSFLKYNSFGAIVTNIGLEHMNTFQTEEGLIQAFQKFIDNVSGPLLFCQDDMRLAKMKTHGFSYGFSPEADAQLSHFEQIGWNIRYNLSFQGKKYEGIEVPLTGRHNALNSAAVFVLSLLLGIDPEKIRQGFLSFRGVERRCEKKGEWNGILFLDDYAHHPTEIAATLKAIRAACMGRRIIALFQPHRYTRTRSCLGSYGAIFNPVEEAIITDIYAASESPIEGVTPKAILSEVPQGKYVSRKDLVETVLSMVVPGDVVVTLGAGDITYVTPQILAKLKEREDARV